MVDQGSLNGTHTEGRWIAWHRQNRIAWHRRIRIAWHRPVCLTMSLTSVAKVRYHPTPHPPQQICRLVCVQVQGTLSSHPPPPTPANPSASMCASPRYVIVPHHLAQQTRRLVCIIPPTPPHPPHHKVHGYK